MSLSERDGILLLAMQFGVKIVVVRKRPGVAPNVTKTSHLQEVGAPTVIPYIMMCRVFIMDSLKNIFE